MPSTFNGVGTKYCGRRDEASDGSYVTTEFVVVGHLPLIPLRSWRVRPRAPSTIWEQRSLGRHEAHESRQFQVQAVPLHWRQVRQVYLEAIILVAAMAVIIAYAGLVLGLAAAAAMAGAQNSRVLYVFLLIITIGIGAIAAKWLMAVMARGRRLIAAQDQRAYAASAAGNPIGASTTSDARHSPETD